MHLSKIFAALALPLLAVAEGDTSTTTMTRYQTLTKTVELKAVVTETSIITNSSSSYLPIGTSSSFTIPTSEASTTASPTEQAPIPSVTPDNAGSALGSAHVALFAAAGMVVAALL